MKTSPISIHHRAKVLALVVSLLVLGTALAASGASLQGTPVNEFRTPLASEPVTLDPAVYSDVYAMSVGQSLFDGLVEFDKDLNMVPAIAKRWIISRDHRTFTFYLRPKVKFHNGREVCAEDFVYSFQRILDPKTKSPAAPFFAYIVGAKAFSAGQAETVAGFSTPDRHTLKIELEEPFAPFLSILATANAKVVPKEEIGPDFGKHPVGTGAFRFQTWEPGRAIRLSANDGYFAGRARIDSLHFQIYSNDQWEVIFSDFEKGLLDQAVIPKQLYDDLAADPKYFKAYQLVSTPGLNLVYIGMNETIPPFDDLRLRQAVSYAVDTEAIAAKITGQGSVPAKGILPPGIAGFDPDFRGYPYDPQKARELLAEAGYAEGRGIGPIEIWTVSKSKRVEKELQAYQKYLAEIGLELVLKVADSWKEFVSLINGKKAPMFYAAWYADYPDPDNFLYILAHSRSPTNRMGYRNPEVDEKLEQARRETDYLRRIELYREIEKNVMAEAPIICQHINTFNCLLQPWVQGVDMNVLGPTYVPLRNVRIDREVFERVASAR